MSHLNLKSKAKNNIYRLNNKFYKLAFTCKINMNPSNPQGLLDESFFNFMFIKYGAIKNG